MEKQWQLEDESLTENFESLPEAQRKRIIEEINGRLKESTRRMQLESESLSQRNAAMRDLLQRRRQFLERLKVLRDELKAEDEAFKQESERLLAA